MTMVGMPLILNRVIIALGDEMSDLQFISIKEFEGKLRQNDSVRTSAGDLATLTAAAGKDMYLASAKVTFQRTGNTTGGFVSGIITLDVNTDIKDSCEFSISGDGADDSVSLAYGTYDFPIGFKVTTGQIIKLEVTVLGSNLSVTGEIQCWEEDTGESPQIPPLNPV